MSTERLSGTDGRVALHGGNLAHLQTHTMQVYLLAADCDEAGEMLSNRFLADLANMS